MMLDAETVGSGILDVQNARHAADTRGKRRNRVKKQKTTRTEWSQAVSKHNKLDTKNYL